MTENRYYEAIDGLRAVAVLLVLFFHAGFGAAKGGFIGVDVFFVISGFLITGMIARDLGRGVWSFGRFYLRRIARLTPALLATIIATLAAGYFILAPEDLARLGRTGVYAAISGSNIFFWLGSGYFDQSAASKPLLHTWSLGVEEQFYLVWPALIFLLARWRGKAAMAAGLAVLGFVSLIAAMVANANNPDAVFFLAPFRIYQFALGGLIALSLTVKPGRGRTLGGVLSVTALIAAAHFASGESGPYWLNAMLPAAAAAMFIWCCEAAPIKAVFTSPPMAWIGKRSYSIYLVHWPVMVLWPMATDFDLSTADGAIAIMISIATGALLYAFVEKPFRFTADKTPFQHSRSLAVTAMLFAVCAIGGAHYWALGGFPGRMAPEFRKYASMQREWDRRLKAVRLDVCNFTEDKPLQSYDSKECATPPGDRRAYMIIGDSYAADAYLFLPRAYPDIYFGQLSLPGCPLNAPSKLKFGPARGWCAKFYKRAFRIARENGFDGVVFTSNWSAERNDIIDALIRWSERNDLDAVFLSARPRFKQRFPVIVTSSMNQAQAERRAAAALPPTSKKLAAAMDTKYGSQVKVVNMYKAMCGDDRCSVFDDQGRILYMDDSHVSVDGAKWLALRFRQTYPDLFK